MLHSHNEHTWFAPSDKLLSLSYGLLELDW